jgi:hypothetical protein
VGTARANDVPVRVEADSIEATRIDDKDVLVLRSGEIARRGRVVRPRLESAKELFVPWSVVGGVRRSHVVIDD